MTEYTAEMPITPDVVKQLEELGVEVSGQHIYHPDLRVFSDKTWAGAWRGYWMDVKQVVIKGHRFLDDRHYEVFRSMD